MNKKILLSGIQPTNSLTIGNYLGAIKQIVDLQDEFKTILFVADLHARTLPLTYHKFKFKDIEINNLNLLKMYIACGVDLKKTSFFFQSQISEHLEMFYFLLTHATLGELKRMTQYKFLSNKLREPNGTECSLMGLLCYPVLMSADILLYDVDFVAVGQDQEQHLELTKNLATRINERYKKEIFKIPDFFLDKNESKIKIMDLQNPTLKMSKSSTNYDGVIFLNDKPEIVEAKIMKAQTDSLNKINLDQINQPGIFNLLNIYSQFKNINLNIAFNKLKNNSYYSLKQETIKVINKKLSEIQKTLNNLNIDEFNQTIKNHLNERKKLAKKKMQEIYGKI